jgi:hypothetical protein
VRTVHRALGLEAPAPSASWPSLVRISKAACIAVTARLSAPPVLPAARKARAHPSGRDPPRSPHQPSQPGAGASPACGRPQGAVHAGLDRTSGPAAWSADTGRPRLAGHRGVADRLVHRTGLARPARGEVGAALGQVCACGSSLAEQAGHVLFMTARSSAPSLGAPVGTPSTIGGKAVSVVGLGATLGSRPRVGEAARRHPKGAESVALEADLVAL